MIVSDVGVPASDTVVKRFKVLGGKIWQNRNETTMKS